MSIEEREMPHPVPTVACEPVPAVIVESREPSDPDRRFERLIPGEAWLSLPDVVRARFSRRLADGEQRFFAGVVVSTRHSRLGLWLARLARIVGGPLPDCSGATGPASVVVTECKALGGQIWTRLYPRTSALPQAIGSVKRFRGPSGLEEYLGYGLVMSLSLSATPAGLTFRSVGYAVELGAWRVALPRLLWPGCCTIEHRHIDGRRFLFALRLEHPVAGILVEQEAVFEELAREPAGSSPTLH